MAKKGKKKIEAELGDWPEELAPKVEGVQRVLGPNDVLFGRGTGISSFEGNKNFRRIVWEYREEYASFSRHMKQAVAKAVITRILNLDPPGRFVQAVGVGEGDGEGEYYPVSYARALEKTQQALREKECSPPAGVTKKPPPKKAHRTSRRAKKKIVEAVVTEPGLSDTEVQKPKASTSRTNPPYRPRSSSSPRKKQIQVPDEVGPRKTTVPVSKLKKPPVTPKVKKQAMKAILGTRHQKNKKTALSAARKALFQPVVDEAPPKLRKESYLKDIKQPRAALADSTPAKMSDTTFCRSVSEHSTAVQAKMPPEQGHGMAFATTAATASKHGNAMPPPGLPPHLSAFIGAVFQAETPPEATKPVRVVAHGPTLCGGAGIYGDDDTRCFLSGSHSKFGVAGGEDGDWYETEGESGSVVPAPPPLVAKHSLCVGDHMADMEVIKEFDPVAAWNTFAVQKKDEW